MPRLFPYAKPPFLGAATRETQDDQAFCATACAISGKSPEALSTTIARIRRSGTRRSLSSERKASTVSRAVLYVTMTTAISNGCMVERVLHLHRIVSLKSQLVLLQPESRGLFQ